MTDPGSILVCRLSALGDVVLTLPVLDALRERFPSARLELLSREPFGRVLTGIPALDALHLWPGPGADLDAAIRSRTWDLVVDLSGTGRSRSLLRGVKRGRTLRARKETLRRMAFVHGRALGGGRVPISPAVDRMFAAIEPLGLTRRGRRPRFGVGPGPADGPVLLAPGGGRDPKRWPSERLAALARRLAARGERVLVVGSGAERSILEEVAAGGAAERVEVIAGPALPELPGIVARCPVAVTNDSGLLHVAEATGARVLAIFGPTHPRLGFAPLGPGSRVLHRGEPCSPCDLHGPRRCPRRHFRCMLEITVDRVERELEALRQEPAGGGGSG